jgi:hypothetical protein
MVWLDATALLEDLCSGSINRRVRWRLEGRIIPSSFSGWDGNALPLDSRRGEDLPDSGGADLVAEVGEFSVDAAVSSDGVLGGRRVTSERRTVGMGGRPGRRLLMVVQ